MASLKDAFRPILIVIGATGTGKSKLALEMACRFNGEIISADSMQIYKGLDIITNKVTPAERKLCKHHLIDFVSPLKSDYTITQFRNAALPIIDDILARKKLPVIVGGTNHYIESILWKFLIDSLPSGESEVQREDKLISSAAQHRSVQQIGDMYSGRSTEDLLSELRTVDLQSSRRIHPKDRRKIIRALDIYHQTGLTRSEHLAHQHNETDSAAVSGSLQLPDTCMIWVECKQSVLDEIVDRRVDEMIENGLVQELLDFHQQYNKDRLAEGKDADYTLGIFQSIGFKEFHEYLTAADDIKNSDEGKKMFQNAVEEVKRATRQYARRQVKWITNRFIKRRSAEVPPVYSVDSTDPTVWDEVVKQRAEKIISCFIKREACDIAPIKPEVHQNEPFYGYCEQCDLTCITKAEWTAHIKGRKHKKRLEGLRKLENFRASRLNSSEKSSNEGPVAKLQCVESSSGT